MSEHRKISRIYEDNWREVCVIESDYPPNNKFHKPVKLLEQYVLGNYRWPMKKSSRDST